MVQSCVSRHICTDVLERVSSLVIFLVSLKVLASIPSPYPLSNPWRTYSIRFVSFALGFLWGSPSNCIQNPNNCIDPNSSTISSGWSSWRLPFWPKGLSCGDEDHCPEIINPSWPNTLHDFVMGCHLVMPSINGKKEENGSNFLVWKYELAGQKILPLPFAVSSLLGINRWKVTSNISGSAALNNWLKLEKCQKVGFFT